MEFAEENDVCSYIKEVLEKAAEAESCGTSRK